MGDPSGVPHVAYFAIQQQSAGIAFSRAVYTSLLGREPEPDAFANAVRLLREANQYPAFTDFVRNSPEAATYLPDAAFVERAYRAALGRSPNAAEQDGLAGAARDVFLKRLIDSAEGRSVLDDDAFVERLYENLLGHAPTADERATVLQALADGDPRSAVLAYYMSSDTFRFAHVFETADPAALDGIFWFP